MSYTLGVLGGSGLYEMEGLRDVAELEVDTPFGAPSDALVKGTLEGRDRRSSSCRATGAATASRRTRSTTARTSAR